MCNLRFELSPRNEYYSWKLLIVGFVVSSTLIIIHAAWLRPLVENEFLKLVTCMSCHCGETCIPCQCGAVTPATRIRQLNKDRMELKDELRTVQWELKKMEKEINWLKKENKDLKKLNEDMKKLHACAEHKIHFCHGLHHCSSGNTKKIKQQLLEAYKTIENQKQEILQLRKLMESSKPSAVKTVEMNISHVHTFSSKKKESQNVASYVTTQREVKCPATPQKARNISAYNRHYGLPKTSCYITPQGEVKCPVIEKDTTTTSTYHLPYLHTSSRNITNQGEMKCISTEKKFCTHRSQYLYSSISDKIRQTEVKCPTITKDRIETSLYHPLYIMYPRRIKCPLIRKDID